MSALWVCSMCSSTHLYSTFGLWKKIEKSTRYFGSVQARSLLVQKSLPSSFLFSSFFHPGPASYVWKILDGVSSEVQTRGRQRRKGKKGREQERTDGRTDGSTTLRRHLRSHSSYRGRGRKQGELGRLVVIKREKKWGDGNAAAA